MIRACALCLLSLCAVASAQVKKGYYVNGDFGFKILVPKGWTQVPIKVDENWIVAKFLSNKFYTDREDGEHRPLLTMIVITDDAKRIRPPENHKVGDTTFIGMASVPYQSYRDYLKRNLAKGYYFTREEEDAKHREWPCERYEVRMHKSGSMKKRLVGWVYKSKGVSVAVDMDILEERYAKVLPIAIRALRSFRFTGEANAVGDAAAADAPKRNATKAASTALLTSELWTSSRDEWRKLGAVQREQKRRQIQDNRHDKVKATTPPSWTVSRSKNFLVVHHTDARYAKRMTDAAEAMVTWMDKHFANLSDEYVRHGVLRICRDYDEYKAYAYKTSQKVAYTPLFWDDREMVSYKDDSSAPRDLGWLVYNIANAYISDKDPYLFRYMPEWMRWGLSGYFGNVQAKGRRLYFYPSIYHREGMALAKRDREVYTLQRLMTLDDEAYWRLYKEDRRLDAHLAYAMRFILEEGRRHKPLRNFLNNYMKAIIAVGEELREKEKLTLARAPSAPRTEEEEEAGIKADNEWVKKWRAEQKKIFDSIHKATCSFTEAEWKKLERAYAAFTKK